ncbi:hypothetical protein GPK26_04885 [Ligilactobacillus ruminis]|nr:hypothetical protein [Ligilactobacillus ruminis]
MNFIKKLFKNKYLQDVMIIFSFAMITIFMTYPKIKTGNIEVYSDWSFHGLRAEQIFLNLKRGNFLTFIATDAFQHTGVGNFLFYPTVFLYPWAVLRLFFKPVTAFYCWYGLIMLATFIIAYFSMKAFSKRWIAAMVFSLSYTLGSYHLYLSTAVFGEFIAASFLPLAFWAFYEVLFRDDSKWPWLGIGMSLIIYSHILSVFITSEIMFVIFVLKLIFDKISKKRFLALIKAAGLSFMLTLFIIVPYLTDFIGKNVTSAQPGVAPVMVKTLMNVLETSFNNNVSPSGIGLILILTAVFGSLWILKAHSKTLTAIYVLGISLIVISTGSFPWNVLSDTPLGMIQLPVRYLSYASMFLSVIIGLAVKDLYDAGMFDTIFKNEAFSLLTIGIFMLFYVGFHHDSLNALKNSQSQFLKNTETFNQLPDRTFVNNSNYDYLLNYPVKYGELDYYPEKARRSTGVISYNETNLSIINNIAVVGRKKIHVSPLCESNKMTYKLHTRKQTEVDLPAIRYKGSYAEVNGKKATLIDSNRGTIKVRTKKGINTITVGYSPSKSYYVGIIISVMTWISFLVLAFYRKGVFKINHG